MVRKLKIHIEKIITSNPYNHRCYCISHTMVNDKSIIRKGAPIYNFRNDCKLICNEYYIVMYIRSIDTYVVEQL